MVFSDDSIITDCLGKVYFRLDLQLNLLRPYINQLDVKFRDDLWRLNFEVLVRWRDNCNNLPPVDMVKDLIGALRSLGLNDVVDIVRDGECFGWFKLIFVQCSRT